MADDKRSAYVGAGVIVGLVAAFLLGNSMLDNDPAPDSSAGSTLTASAVGLVAQGLSRGHSPRAIASQVLGPAAAGAACTSVIESLVEYPEDPVTITVDAEGGLLDTTVTRTELTSPPPAPTGLDIPGMIECARWNVHVLYEMCVDGRLEPPAS